MSYMEKWHVAPIIFLQNIQLKYHKPWLLIKKTKKLQPLLTGPINFDPPKKNFSSPNHF